MYRHTRLAHPIPGRRLIAMLASLGCAVAVAACGGSGQSGNAASLRTDAGIKFADCMRTHGVSNFPDPSAGGGIQIPDGVNPKAPAFQSAQTACLKYLPGGGPGRGHASEQRKLEMLKLARCMRAHGLPSFPDPTATAPSPAAAQASGLGLAFGSPGSFIAVPQTLLQSPAFKGAAAVCGFPGGGRPAKKSAALG